jgi:hypothetical protein
VYLKFPTVLLEFFYPKNYSVRLTLMIKWMGYLLYYTIVPYHAYQAVLYLLISWPLVLGYKFFIVDKLIGASPPRIFNVSYRSLRVGTDE